MGAIQTRESDSPDTHRTNELFHGDLPEAASPMAHLARQRTPARRILRTLILFCIIVSGAGAQHRILASTSAQSGLVKLPVIDKQDIRFTHVSGDRESFQNRIPGGI